MRYEDYAKKVEKVAKIKRFVAKNIIAFLIVGIVIGIAAISLTSATGAIIDKNSYTNTIEYGQDIDYTAEAVFKTVDYEYCIDGTDEWSNVVPREAGNYLVRAISQSAFGTIRYGDAHEFTITSKTINIFAVEKEITFGDNPSVSGDSLIPGDKVTCSSYSYGTFTKSQTTVEPNVSAIKIIDKDGNDVTDSYIISTVQTAIKFKKKAVKIETASFEKVYDGTPIADEYYKKYTLKDGGLRESDEINIEYVNSRTYVGSVDNKVNISIIDKTDGSDVSVNYNVTTTIGRLTITKRPIKIKSKSGSWTYDNKDHTLSNIYDVTYYNDTALPNETITVVNDTTVHNVISAASNEISIAIIGIDEEDLTNNYDITYEYGALSVTKRPLAIVTASDEWIFDGDSHTNSTYDITYYKDDNLGHVVKVASNPVSIKFFGEKSNTMTFKVYQPNATKDIDVTSNYYITVTPGTLSIKKRTISITTNSSSFVYDDDFHISSGFSVDYALPENHIFVVKSETKFKEVTNEGVIKNNVAEYIIKDGVTNEIITDNYSITYNYGTVVVTKRPVNIETASHSWMYDNKVHSDNNVTMSAYGEYALLAGHRLQNKTSETSVKTYNGDGVDNVVSFIIVNGDDVDVTSNYDFADNITYGKLIITKRLVLITSNSDEKVYDNKPLSNSGYTAILNDGSESTNAFATGDKETVIITSSITNVLFNTLSEIIGIDNVIDSITVFEGDTDKTENYAFTKVCGKLKILQREITITAGSDEKVYDNTPLTLNTFESLTFAFSGETPDNYGYIVNGDIFDFTVISSITYVLFNGDEVVGTANTISAYTIKDDDDNDKSSNYKVTLVSGTLTILPREITITTGSFSKVYDNYAISFDNHSITLDSVTTGEPNAEGDVISVTVSPASTLKTVGEIKNKCTYTINEDTTDKSSNYIVNISEGTLSITKRLVTVTASNATKVFDNKPLTCHAYTLSFTGTAPDEYGYMADGDTETVTFKISSTITYVKDSVVLNKIDTVTVSDGVDKTSNYDFTFVDGSLSITKFSIDATTASHTWVYNATTYSDKAITLSAIEGASEDDKTFVSKLLTSITNFATIRNVGTLDNEIAFEIHDNGNINITDNFTFVNVNYGTLEVIPRYITILSGSTEKTYNGTPLEYKNYTISLTTHDYGDVDVPAGNVDLYRLELVLSNFTQITDVVRDTTDNTIIKSVLNEYTYDFVDAIYIDNYVVNATYGTLKINPKSITISANSATYVYDNNEFTLSGYTCSDLTVGNVLSTGDSLSVTVGSANAKSVGTYDILVTAYQMTLDDVDKTGNYTVSTQKGTLEIVKRKIKLTANSNEKVYDGTALSDNGYTSEYISSYSLSVIQPSGDMIPAIANGDSISITITGTITNAGYITNAISYSFSDSLGDNYDVTAVDGTLTIKKRAITITSKSATKIYDGTALSTSADDYSYSVTNADGGIPSCDKLTITLGTSTTNAGSVDNAINYTIVSASDSSVDRSGNYSVTKNVGKLTVLKRKVSILSGTASKQYDGTPLTKKDGLTITLIKTGYDGDLTLADDASVSPSGETINVDIKTEMLNVYLVDGVPTAIDNAFYLSDITVTGGSVDNYEFVRLFGTLKVTQREISAVTATNTFTYDGLPHKDTTVTFSPASLGDVTFYARITSYIEFTDVSESGTNELSFDIVDQNGNEINDNFILTGTTYGTITIIKRAITIVPQDNTKYYDGDTILGSYNVSLTEHGLDDPIARCDTLSVEYHYDSTLVDAGSTTFNISSYTLSHVENYDVTCNTSTKGTLTISKRPIKITSLSASHVYDGKVFQYQQFTVTKNSSDITGSPLVGDDIVEVAVTGSITDPGTTPNSIGTIAFKVGNANNYDITKELGTLEVTKRIEIIKITYTGTASSYGTGTTLSEGTNGYQVIKDGLLTGHTLTVKAKRSGSKTNYTATIKSGSNDVSSKYDITILTTDNNILVEVTNLDAELGELDTSDYTVTYGSVESGETLIITKTAEHTYTSKVLDSTSTDVTAKYNITVTETEDDPDEEKTDVTISPNSIIKEYDGTPLEPDGAIVSGLPDGYTISYELSGSQLAIGTSAATVSSYIIRNSAGVDVTSDFNVITETGELTVTPCYVVIFIVDGGIENGTTLTENVDYIVLSGTISTGDTLVVEKTDIGAYSASISPSSNSGNYMIKFGIYVNVKENTEADGILGSTYYDVIGSIPTVDTLIITKSGTSYTANVTRDNTDITNLYAIIIKSPEEEDDTKIAIVVTPVNLTKVYDGTELSFTNPVYGTNNELSIIPALPDGYTYVATITGSQTVVGSSTSTITSFVIYNGTEDVTDEFSIVKKTGHITVTKATIAVKITPKTVLYGDTIQFTSSDINVVSGLPEGYTLNIDLSSVPTLTKTGEYYESIFSDITYTVLNASSQDVSDNFALNIQSGKVATIKGKIIKVSVISVTKDYDGTPLTSSDCDVTGSLISGHTFAYVDDSGLVHFIELTGGMITLPASMCDGSITTPGTVTNNIVANNLIIVDSTGISDGGLYDENYDVTDNYIITTTSGKLTIN